jgi:hypothetical protein
MQLMRGPFEELAALIASVVLPIAIASLFLAASALAFEIAIRRFQDRRPARAREVLFVGRWGDLGPELYLVGAGVRKLANPDERTHARVAVEFSRRMLAEAMQSCPATQLVSAFARARLEPLPPDGFVISKSDVETWLDTARERAAYARRAA